MYMYMHAHVHVHIHMYNMYMLYTHTLSLRSGCPALSAVKFRRVSNLAGSKAPCALDLISRVGHLIPPGFRFDNLELYW